MSRMLLRSLVLVCLNLASNHPLKPFSSPSSVQAQSLRTLNHPLNPLACLPTWTAVDRPVVDSQVPKQDWASVLPGRPQQRPSLVKRPPVPPKAMHLQPAAAAAVVVAPWATSSFSSRSPPHHRAAAAAAPPPAWLSQRQFPAARRPFRSPPKPYSHRANHPKSSRLGYPGRLHLESPRQSPRPQQQAQRPAKARMKPPGKALRLSALAKE